VVLALECGLRRDEIRHLRWCDVDLGNQLLYIQRQSGWTPKNHQARVIPLSPGLALWLKQYRVSLERRLGRVPHAEDPVAMYEPEARARWRSLGPRWSANALSATVSELWAGAGIQRTNRHALHALRATFASRAMLRGGDIVSVQALMGHADIGTTRGYLSHNAESLRRAVRAASSL
jgi:integrase